MSIGGFEWNDWIDVRAAERILDLLSDSPERLGEESLRIVAASPDSVVQMIGQRGRLRSMGLSGAYRTMVDSALEHCGREPHEPPDLLQVVGHGLYHGAGVRGSDHSGRQC